MATATPSLWDNPLGTDGFEFIEYAAPDPAATTYVVPERVSGCTMGSFTGFAAGMMGFVRS